MAPGVRELDLQMIALSTPNRGPRHGAVIGPGSEVYTGCYFDLAVDGGDIVLALDLSVRKRGHRAVVEVLQK